MVRHAQVLLRSTLFLRAYFLLAGALFLVFILRLPMLFLGMQQSSTTVLEDAVTVVEDAVDQLPSDSQLQRNAVKAMEAVEEVISPSHLAEKRLQRKQRKARSATSPILRCCTQDSYCATLQGAAVTSAGSRLSTRFPQLQPQQQSLR